MHTSLINHIRQYIQLEEKQLELIYRHFKAISLKKKDHLLNEGQICKYCYFVTKGCLRMYFYRDNGTEQITQFALENWWLTDYSSFISQVQSNYNIQAVENSDILAIEYSTYDQLLEEVPALERYFRIMAQIALAASQVRQKLMFDMSKEDMYLHFKSSFPDFTQRIPQYMLASFLGLTPEYLSELRKKNL
ncbi:MAG: Crp/Fnr family transcriptional regulator [Dysgonomonas sp.]